MFLLSPLVRIFSTVERARSWPLPTVARGLGFAPIAVVAMVGMLAGGLACDPATTPPAESPVGLAGRGDPVTEPKPEGTACALESAVAALGPGLPTNCGLTMPEGVCDERCKDAVRACVLESARESRPFAVTWTNGMVNGVGTRRGVVGRRGPKGFELSWVDYTWISTVDPVMGTLTQRHIRIATRTCEELDDLEQACDPRLSVKAAACAQPAKQISDDARLRCEGAETLYCED